ncbi:MAG: 50S ribosomal protein L29 [Ignavibacteria bacterium CG_4_8_14_3_um_filter_37_9]|nr:50S ribosomal protein L29 [Ignavibacteria bacterium]OIO24104.1 MAG: 50S ribosomal protein L29 [Ignavibacteria bacterium CG1_02_37_35]PIP79307.1 MAG: 50S ribosomal protein L29 [Ignavibacteria bacterium CG22_combo_CG10-13_8_21_14_all_37_15]PIS44737.1 MAG: 50S ribosomal protein L29 [Ignavibacteria bacterium CG08_land_8_20_14_0_20_37_9]PIW98323.1 MAG: 50S ribosomal protein L29 [Ignavibacteria bacterium CG_4_8_14_3_um_filter_37_9]PIX95478.1 MAG: 50S ribosomal protein L29 [Ignavibacteria bacteriu
MKLSEIKEMSSEEIGKQLIGEESNLVDLRFSHELKQLTNTSKLRSTKKEIARMKTILKERELLEKISIPSEKGVDA